VGVSEVQKASTLKSEHFMGVAIPKHMLKTRRVVQRSCHWCGTRKLPKHLYKLRDGPIDWWFCNDEHALEWLDHRHQTPAINAMLRVCPSKRDLGGKTIDEWVRDELSHHKQGDGALPEASGCSDGLCNVHNGEMSM
jgi:hypothetical protein